LRELVVEFCDPVVDADCVVPKTVLIGAGSAFWPRAARAEVVERAKIEARDKILIRRMNFSKSGSLFKENNAQR
jgi:hypothetical protein